MTQTLHRSWDIPVEDDYDLVVVGGGPSGSAAALAAGRAGLSVLVIDAEGQLGGIATSGLVSHWLGGRTPDTAHWVVGGIFRELSEEGAARGIATIPVAEPGPGYTPHGWTPRAASTILAGIPIDPAGMAKAASPCIDDAFSIACFGLLARRRFARTWADGSLLIHALTCYNPA